MYSKQKAVKIVSVVVAVCCRRQRQQQADAFARCVTANPLHDFISTHAVTGTGARGDK